MGLKPPLNKSQTLNDDPLGYEGEKKNVHLNCSERKKESEGQHLWPPHTARGGGTGEGKSSREGPWDKAEMWLPCNGCHRPAMGRQPSRDQESSGFWMFRQKCLIAPSASIPALCGSSGMQGLTQPCSKYLKYFHSTLIFYFFSFVFIGLVTI